MGVNIANWDETKFSGMVINSYVEAGRIPDDSYIRQSSTEAKTVFPALGSITVKNAADNVLLADAGATETSVTISADTTLKGWVWIPLSAISTHGTNNVVQSYAEQLGQDMRAGYEKRLAILAATSSPSAVTFDDELTDATGLGAEIAAALKNVNKTFDIANAPAVGRFCLLHPTYFSTLWNVAGTRSSDYITGADNSKPFSELNFMGMRVRSYTGAFGASTAADSNYPSKYQADFTNATGSKTWGVAWIKSAMGVNVYEDLTVSSDLIPQNDAILVKARMLVGTGLLRGAGYRVAINGD